MKWGHRDPLPDITRNHWVLFLKCSWLFMRDSMRLNTSVGGGNKDDLKTIVPKY